MPMEAPLDGFITRAATGGFTRSKQLQKTYMAVKLGNGIRIIGRGG